MVSAASSVEPMHAHKHLEAIEHSHAAISVETMAGVVGALSKVTSAAINAFVHTKPTHDIIVVAAALCVLLGVKDPSWTRCRRIIRKEGFLDKLAIVAPTMLGKKARKAARTLLRQHTHHLQNLRVDKLTQSLMDEADAMDGNAPADSVHLLGAVLHGWCVCMSWYNPAKARAVPASGLGSMSGLQLDKDVLQAFRDQGFERPAEAATAAAAAAALELVNGKSLEQAMKKFGFYLSPELLDKFEHHFSALRAARRKKRQGAAQALGGAGSTQSSTVDAQGPTLEQEAAALSLEQGGVKGSDATLDASIAAAHTKGSASDSDSDLDEGSLAWQRAVFSSEAARKGKTPKLLAARGALLGVDATAFGHLQESDPTVQPVAVAAACLCIVFERIPCWKEAKALFSDANNTLHALVSLQRRELPLRKRMLLAALMRSRNLMDMHPAKFFLTGVVLAVFFNWLRAYISTPTLPADKIFVPRSARLQGVEYSRAVAKQRQALGQRVQSKDGQSTEDAGGFQGKVSEAWDTLQLDAVPPLLPPQLTGRMLHLLAALGSKASLKGDTIHVGVSALASQSSLRAAYARARTRLSALRKLQELRPSRNLLPELHPLNRARRGLLELDPVDLLLFRKQESPLALECAVIAGALCSVLGLAPNWNAVSQVMADPQAMRNLALLDPQQSGHHDGHVQAQDLLHTSHDAVWGAVKYSRYKTALRVYRWLQAFLQVALSDDEHEGGDEGIDFA
jgi:DTW domain-containing protein YfiP